MLSYQPWTSSRLPYELPFSGPRARRAPSRAATGRPPRAPRRCRVRHAGTSPPIRAVEIRAAVSARLDDDDPACDRQRDRIPHGGVRLDRTVGTVRECLLLDQDHVAGCQLRGGRIDHRRDVVDVDVRVGRRDDRPRLVRHARRSRSRCRRRRSHRARPCRGTRTPPNSSRAWAPSHTWPRSSCVSRQSYSMSAMVTRSPRPLLHVQASSTPNPVGGARQVACSDARSGVAGGMSPPGGGTGAKARYAVSTRGSVRRSVPRFSASADRIRR